MSFFANIPTHTPLAAHFVKTKTNETEPKRIVDLFSYAV